jgi:CheY-like chemotaxis protein
VPPLVALVRDASDEDEAIAAGVFHALRKPFDRSELEAVLVSLGLRVRNPR